MSLCRTLINDVFFVLLLRFKNLCQVFIVLDYIHIKSRKTIVDITWPLVSCGEKVNECDLGHTIFP